VVHIFFHSREELTDLAARLDVWEVHRMLPRPIPGTWWLTSRRWRPID
jgi:hypothetical protein